VSIYFLALVLGALTGLRTMTAPTAISIAARMGWLDLNGTWLAWLGYGWTPWILGICAIVELIVDQRPTTPSRTTPMPFIARVLAGTLAGAAIGASQGSMTGGIVAGVIGAVIGTLAGYALRMRLAKVFRRDRPAAFIEDAIAYLGAALVVSTLLPKV
jgi:uncharacterized membrane protein